jgi:hypothetical protein
MKNNSMNTAPKGRMPPIRIERTGLMYHTWRKEKEEKLLRLSTTKIHKIIIII